MAGCFSILGIDSVATLNKSFGPFQTCHNTVFRGPRLFLLHSQELGIQRDICDFFEGVEVELDSEILVIDDPASLILDVYVLNDVLESGKRVVSY